MPEPGLTTALWTPWAWPWDIERQGLQLLEDYPRNISGVSQDDQNLSKTLTPQQADLFFFPLFPFSILTTLLLFLPPVCSHHASRPERSTLPNTSKPSNVSPFFRYFQVHTIFPVSQSFSLSFARIFRGRLRPPILQSLVVPIQQQLLLGCFSARDLADLAWSTARLELLRRSGPGRDTQM